MRLWTSILLIAAWGLSCQPPVADPVGQDPQLVYQPYEAQPTDQIISRADYYDKLQGFWLAQCIANWTGLITEMDKLGGEGVNGKGAGFYTRANWGGPDHVNIWSAEGEHPVSDTIDFYLLGPDEVWGADDDTDIEYMYQHLLYETRTPLLTAEQIREGWLKHIYSEANTPFKTRDGKYPENYLWVSNQQAHDLMVGGMLPPETSLPVNNPHYEMIDAQLTTEIFGLYAPLRPDLAMQMSYLPIRTTAYQNAQWIAEFYVIMYSLALWPAEGRDQGSQLRWMADQARTHLPDSSYAADMYDYVKGLYEQDVSWEAARDSIYQRYQVEQAAGYTWPSQEPGCNGCFAAGINYAASLVSLFFGNGNIRETIKIGALSGWDSDNPTATWGGLIGFMMGRKAVEQTFGQPMSTQFNIHRTRGGFPQGIDTFESMARKGVWIVDRVVQEHMQGGIDLQKNQWQVPLLPLNIQPTHSN